MSQVTPCTATPASNTNTTALLSPAELKALDGRLAANADALLNKQRTKGKRDPQSAHQTPKATSGRKGKSIANPFYGYIGCTTLWGRYPRFAMDVVEGIARADWHDRTTKKAGKSMPLSVRKIMVLLESLSIITNYAAQECLHLRERHARRYVKAVELIIPRMMECRPKSLVNEMDGVEPEAGASDWEDDLTPPNPEALAKFQYDLRTLEGHEQLDIEYEIELNGGVMPSNVVTFLPPRKEHPKKAEALEMLESQASIKHVVRELGVSRNTVRKWQQELMAA